MNAFGDFSSERITLALGLDADAAESEVLEAIGRLRHNDRCECHRCTNMRHGNEACLKCIADVQGATRWLEEASSVIIAAERARCLKIAKSAGCGWKCDCGHNHAEDIAARIEAGGD